MFRENIYGADTIYNISIADKIQSALVLEEPIYAHYLYKNKKMNVSVGKYYSYEHNMHNEIYTSYKLLFERWKLKKEDYIDLLCKERMSGLTHELKGLQAINCPFSIEEKLQFALYGCMDEIVSECVQKNNREELESRILSGIKELLLKENIDVNSKMYFIYELLESLLRYEKNEEDYKKIEHAINHPMNPFHIGKYFYKKLLQ